MSGDEEQARRQIRRCRLNAEAKLGTTGDATKYAEAIAKCGEKLTTGWQKATEKAVDAGAACLDGALTVNAFQGVMDGASADVATALAGGALSDCPSDLASCEAQPTGRLVKTGQNECTSGSSVIPCAGTGQDGEFQSGLARSYTDNGNGTVTDDNTGLVWEKLSDDSSIHDKDDLYTFFDAITVKVATLNASAFAGHTDWRVPNFFEILSLKVMNRPTPSTTARIAPEFNTGCVFGCSVLTCSCVPSSGQAIHWSSTFGGAGGWMVAFRSDLIDSIGTGATLTVRAVRGGS